MIIDHKQEDALSLAIRELNDEHIFIYPTDTIYGFGGDARSEKVIERLYELKKRPDHMPISMLVPDQQMLEEYAFCSDMVKTLVKNFLPGALTLVLPAKDKDLPSRLFSVQGYLGFRIPDHEFCNKLATEFHSPVITTSVNISGQAALNNIGQIGDQFGNEVALIVSDPELDKRKDPIGSTVVMVTLENEIKVLREGSIPSRSINKLFI